RDAYAQLMGSISSQFPIIVKILLENLQKIPSTSYEQVEGHMMALGWAGSKIQGGLIGDLQNKVITTLIQSTQHNSIPNFSQFIRKQALRAILRILSSQKNELNKISSELMDLVGNSVSAHFGDIDVNVRRAAALVAPLWVNYQSSDSDTEKINLDSKTKIMSLISQL
ncbi:MAG: hypothetical protein EZS28_056682, partial [Streblomastix strix]